MLERYLRVGYICKCEILEGLGAKIEWIDKHTITIDARNITTTQAPLDLTSIFLEST